MSGVLIALIACGCLGVLGVVGFIGFVVAIPAMAKAKDKADQAKSKNNLRLLLQAVHMFERQHSRPPRGIEELVGPDKIIPDPAVQNVPNGKGTKYIFVPYTASARSNRPIFLEPTGSWPDVIHVASRDGVVRGIKAKPENQVVIADMARAGKPIP